MANAVAGLRAHAAEIATTDASETAGRVESGAEGLDEPAEGGDGVDFVLEGVAGLDHVVPDGFRGVSGAELVGFPVRDVILVGVSENQVHEAPDVSVARGGAIGYADFFIEGKGEGIEKFDLVEPVLWLEIGQDNSLAQFLNRGGEGVLNYLADEGAPSFLNSASRTCASDLARNSL